MFNKKVNSFVAVFIIVIFGIGASYTIIKFANNTDLNYLATNTEILN